MKVQIFEQKYTESKDDYQARVNGWLEKDGNGIEIVSTQSAYAGFGDMTAIMITVWYRTP